LGIGSPCQDRPDQWGEKKLDVHQIYDHDFIFVFFLGLIFPLLYAEKKEDLKVHDGTMRRGRRS